MTFQKMPDLISSQDDTTAKLLADADKLMQRRRVFVASQSPPASAARSELFFEGADANTLKTALTAPPTHLGEDDADHDLPLLTEKVTSLAPSLADIQALQRDAIQKELTCWLEQELPLAILKVTDGVADQLLGEITRKAEDQLLPHLLAHLGNLPSENQQT